MLPKPESAYLGDVAGGFIWSTADSIRPETPPENASAYFEAAREFGGRAYALSA